LYNKKMPKLRFDQYFSLFCVLIGLLFFPGQNVLNQLGESQFRVHATELPQRLKTTLRVPMYIGELSIDESLNNLTASSVYVMDFDSGSILLQKKPAEARYPASTVKMMTALTVRKIYNLDDVITVQEEAFTTGTTAGLQLGEQFKIRDLLKALLIPSGNDAAFVLANHHPLGYSGFIAAMNNLAKEIHLKDTTFQNPSGLDKEAQTSTARDLAILAKEVMKDDILREIVGTKQGSITDLTQGTTHTFTNTHELLGMVDGVVGIKTGTTEFAGENLITEVDRDGKSVIIVVLGSKDRFQDTRNIIDWVFSHYSWEEMKRE
jgi:D-alanyl-D-alanine carboxypeptidase (penicillin-binding protein 5/6)